MLTREPYTIREKRSRPRPSLPISRNGSLRRVGGEQMPVRKRCARTCGARSSGANLRAPRIDHVHRMRVEEPVRPFRRRAQMQRASADNRASRDSDRSGRRARKTATRPRADRTAPGRSLRSEPVHDASRHSRATPADLAGTAIGSASGPAMRQHSRHRAHCDAIEEKSTRGSTATSAMSASRLPTSSRTVPISTDPITR